MNHIVTINSSEVSAAVWQKLLFELGYFDPTHVAATAVKLTVTELALTYAP